MPTNVLRLPEAHDIRVQIPREDTLLGGVVTGSWLDAQSFPPLEWHVEGIIPEGFGFLSAPPKAGKSWMAASIALACASGGTVFEKIPVAKRPVLYLALEDGYRRLQSRFRTLSADGVISPDVSVTTTVKPYDVHAIIAEWLADHSGGAPLVIIDTFGKARTPRRGNDVYTDDYNVGSQFKTLVDDVPGAGILAVHHTRKAAASDFIDANSGSQGLTGAADYVLILERKRHASSAILHVTGRDVEEGQYALTTENGRWMLNGATLADAAANARQQESRSKKSHRMMDVLRYVNAHPEGVRAKDVDEGLGITNARQYLSRLAADGLLDKHGRGLYAPLSGASDDPISTRHSPT